MKKVIFLCFIAAMACLLCACTIRESAAMPTEVTEANTGANIPSENAPLDTSDKAVDRTAELKTLSYRNFKGSTMDLIVTDGYVIDLGKFFELAGLKYAISGGIIDIYPQDYNADEDFFVKIYYSAPLNIVNGDTIGRERQDDGSWREQKSHESATDFIFDAVLGEQKLKIGADELDYLWREIRLLSAPADKAAEINAEVDAELASYYADPDLQ